jgi:HK97 family phage prohead protease
MELHPETGAYFDALDELPNVRSATFDDLDFKDGGNVFLFDGYAAVYESVTDLGSFTEEVRSGAFDKVLEGVAAGTEVVPMLHEHDPREFLASTRSGRLTLESDKRGLRVKAKLVKTDLSARVKALHDAGEVSGMSYGFVAGKGNATVSRSSSKPHRALHGFRKVLDVSTTWDPAYPSTEAHFRSRMLQFADSPESWQRLLLGAYPQLGELGHDFDRQDEEDAETRATETVVAAEETAGVADQMSVAARRRRLSFLVLTHGGIDHEA